MRDFSMVAPSLWHSERFTGLTSDDARLAYLYLLTSPHQNSAGAYRLPDGYAASDLRWPVDRYQKARAELVTAGLVKHDASASVIMITRWFRFNAPQNEKHLTGIRRILEKLPSQSIWEAATEELEAALDATAKAKAERQDKEEPPHQTASKSWKEWKPRIA